MSAWAGDVQPTQPPITAEPAAGQPADMTMLTVWLWLPGQAWVVDRSFSWHYLRDGLGYTPDRIGVAGMDLAVRQRRLFPQGENPNITVSLPAPQTEAAPDDDAVEVAS